MRNVAETDAVFLEQLVYTWAERTLTGTGNGVVLRSSGWPTGNSIAADSALADFVEYLPAKLQHRLGSGRTPPLGADFWQHPEYGTVVAMHRYLGVDSAGRGGRSIVHVFLDRERRLDARSALELCQGPLVASEWALTAEPVQGSDGINFVPGQQLTYGRRPDSDLLLPTLTGILEYLIHGRQIVFIQDHDVDALGLLETCLGVLPRALAGRVTFSTFRGVPQRSKCAVAFASTIFSEVLPKADVQKTYVHLDSSNSKNGESPRIGQAPHTGFSAAASDLASELLRLLQAGGPTAPADISTVHTLDQWISHRDLALRPVDSLQLADCETLLSLPANTSWVHRDPIIDRAAKLTATATPITVSRPSFLAYLGTEEKEAFGRTLHSMAVTELVSSPRRALAAKHQADALGYQAERLVALAVPVLDSLALDETSPEPALEQFIAEVARFVPLPQRVVWASRPIFQDPLLNDWEPTSAAIAKRTWTEPHWASAHAAAARAVALRHPKSSAEFLATALAGYDASPSGIDLVLAMDQELNDEAFTDVVRNVVSLPWIQTHQLRRLAASDLLPTAIRAEIRTITDPPIEELPASPLSTNPPYRPDSAKYSALPSITYTAFTPNPPSPEPARPQPWVPSIRDSSSRDRGWMAADRSMSLVQGAPPSVGQQSESTEMRQPAATRRRTLVRMLGVVLSTAAGYLVAESNWSLFVWPPALLTVLIALVLIILPSKLPARATEVRLWRFLTVRRVGRRQPLKIGSRFSWKARKPSE